MRIPLQESLHCRSESPTTIPRGILTLDEDPEADYEGICQINALEWLVGKADYWLIYNFEFDSASA